VGTHCHPACSEPVGVVRKPPEQLQYQRHCPGVENLASSCCLSDSSWSFWSCPGASPRFVPMQHLGRRYGFVATTPRRSGHLRLAAPLANNRSLCSTPNSGGRINLRTPSSLGYAA
jgi:hypothetical protein